MNSDPIEQSILEHGHLAIQIKFGQKAELGYCL
jgi:hypothetical protein